MKIAYVHIPKTGGGSVKHWWTQDVDPLHKMINQGHKDLHFLADQTTDLIDTSFTVVRNTWKKLISNYVYTRTKLAKKKIKRPYDTLTMEACRHHDMGIIPFTEWMRSINHHNVRCQVSYSQNVEHIIVDHDPRQWSAFCQLLGVDHAPAHTHRVQRYDYAQYLTQDFIEWTADHYALEIERFGFKPPVAK